MDYQDYIYQPPRWRESSRSERFGVNLGAAIVVAGACAYFGACIAITNLDQQPAHAVLTQERTDPSDRYLDQSQEAQLVFNRTRQDGQSVTELAAR